MKLRSTQNRKEGQVSTGQACVARRRTSRFARGVTAVCLAALASTTGAQVDLKARRGSFTAAELAVLPPYCRNMQGFPGYEGAPGNRWRRLMGSDFQHIHHYCRGLRDVYYVKLLALSPQNKQLLWERAVNEFDYIIKNSRPDMVLMPEVYYQKGEALIHAGRPVDAIDAFKASRVAKPDYWPAYVAWADYLIQKKQLDDARDLLATGLRHAPGSQEIQQRLAKLPGGPAAIAAVAESRAASAASAASAAP
jgi:tetratricopeptide (TPR) repeat protein